MAEKKKEKTIRSEVTKVFLVIFAILAIVGIFTIFSAIRGANTFQTIREVHLKQYKAAELMKQRALDVIAIYYLLATDQDQEFLMKELKRYDGLVESFDQARGSMVETFANDTGPEKAKVLGLLEDIKKVFFDLNNHCREMTFAMMEGKKKVSAAKLPAINEGIKTFKGHLDDIEGVVSNQLDTEANRAQSLLRNITWLGVAITILAIFITLGLIYYLMQFLSISLLPISNLMHNMRQAVFSIDKNLKVISPVARYSNTVFGEDIVGKNVADIVYKEVNQKSEAFSKTQMALDVVFGADDLQWMLQEDGLMRQVKRTFEVDGTKQEKILKLTYTPLLENDLVQNIMIVAEDVTEIEKLRAEAQQGDMVVIKGVIGVDPTDLEAFLTGAQSQILECRSLLPKLEKDAEARKLLFRILHTLKGNSRMYRLNAISEVVHVTESSVVEINKQVDSGAALTAEHNESISRGLDNVEDILALHSKMARKLFGIKDLYSGRAEEQLHRAISAVETALELNTALDSSNGQEGGSDIKALGEAAIKAAQYFESASVVDLLKKLIEGGGVKPEGREKFLADLSGEYLGLLVQNGGVKVMSLDASRWISLFQGVLDLSQELDSTAGVIKPENLAKLKVMAQALVVLSDSENLGFVRKAAVQISQELSRDASASQLTKLKGFLASLWRFMAAVCALDSTYSLEASEARSILGELETHRDNSSKLDLNKITSAKVLAISLLRSLSRRSLQPDVFWKLAQKYLGIDSGQCVNAFFGIASSRGNIDRLFDQLKEGSAFDWKGFTAKLDAEFPIFQLMTKEPLSGQLRLDVMRLLVSHKTKDGVSPFESEAQMVEIPVQSFNEIKSLALGMAKTEPTVKQLQSVIQHAFDSPIKTVCRKMEPMVSELSKRMGKEIAFRVSGENISVARDAAYSLRDALVHIIRNSLDHGIETPEERVGKGKPPKAALEVNVTRNGKFVEVSVRDDGRGIDTDKLVQKAVSLGKIPEAQASKLSRDERLQLVFLANLSTKEEVTALSGRGVGMDAVRSTVDKMGGTVSVSSTFGTGTEFKMSIGEASV